MYLLCKRCTEVALITLVLQKKQEIQDPQGNIWCRTYSPSNNGWVHKHTIEVEEKYK